MKKININVEKLNFAIIISIFTIAFLLIVGLGKILKYSSLQFHGNGKYINLSNNVEYFIPEDGQNQDINLFINNSQNKFTNNNFKSIYFRGNVKKVWLKLRLRGNQADIKNILYIDCQFIENIQFYIPTTDNKFVLVKPKHYFTFPYINLPENTDFNKDIYINLTWNANVFNLLLAQDRNFYINQNLLTCFYMGNFGIIIGMIIINIILYFSSRDKKYLFHSLFAGSLLSLIYCLSGMQRQIFGFMYDNHLIALGAMTSLAWVLFMYSYLDIKNNIPILNKFFLAGIILLMVGLFTSEILPSRFTYNILFLFIFIAGMSFIVSIYSYFKFHIGSIYYLIGVFILFSGIIVYISASYGLIKWNMLTLNAWYPAAAIETMLFTIGIISQIKNEKERNNRLQLAAVTDKLTGLYNRRYFEENVRSRICNLDMEETNVSILLIDIDHFKNVNDNYGHHVGDYVLKEIAMLIKCCIRKQDTLIRWGGEEFAVILFGANAEEGIIISEKLRENIENHIFKYVEKATVSVGVAEKQAEESFENWFKRVDQAMYRAKECGRNKVCGD